MPYHLYVIGLKADILSVRKFREANPDYIEGRACYYVGYTSKSPEVRSLQHRDAIRKQDGSPLFSRIVHKYYDGLRPRKFQHLPSLDSIEDALEAEKNLTLRLRKRGFGVWSN
ncbi:ribose-5-phosphate isomerase [Flavobacteriales bacterium]|nr:ribose-5-phosphate isomerase [Flavobacteriales bacterium]